MGIINYGRKNGYHHPRNKMARPKKFPTKVVRIRKEDWDRMRRLAKLKGISLPDYINWKLKKYDK